VTHHAHHLVLTREISAAIEQCELTHVARTPIDVARARQQHAEYERTIESLGWKVQRLPAPNDMPDSVFVEDTAFVLDELAIITRPGAESRRRETAAVSEALRSYRPLVAILAPATLDGGDVLTIGKRIFVGVGGRTNDMGAKQLRAMVKSQGYTVDVVEFRDCLHLKTAATLVADDTLLVNPAWTDPAQFGVLRTIEVHPNEPFAANSLRIDDTVIYPAEHVRTRERLEQAGLTVRPVAIDELMKAEGSVTCLSLLVR
jgi:dimethylargininase